MLNKILFVVTTAFPVLLSLAIIKAGSRDSDDEILPVQKLLNRPRLASRPPARRRRIKAEVLNRCLPAMQASTLCEVRMGS